MQRSVTHCNTLQHTTTHLELMPIADEICQTGANLSHFVGHFTQTVIKTLKSQLCSCCVLPVVQRADI